MFAVLLTLFILVSLVLMIVVLMQSSKGGGLAGAFGGGGSDSSVMGGRSAATFLGKLTVWLAVSFMALALVLAIMSSRVDSNEPRDESIIAKRQQEGSLDVFNVEESGSILDQIQTEGFEGGEDAESTTPPAPADEPAPEGN